MGAGTSLALVSYGFYSKQLNVVNIPLQRLVGHVSWDSEYLLSEYSMCLTAVSGNELMLLDGLDGLERKCGDSKCIDIQLIFADHSQKIHVLRSSVTVDGH